MKYLTLCLLVPLGGLMVEDFRHREVSIAWLATMAACVAGVAVVFDGWREMFVRSGLNMLLVAYMGAGVVAWAWIKSRRFINPVNRYIGLGDVLFFVALTPFCSLKSFAWLLVGCMAFSLVFWSATRTVRKERDTSQRTVPLVGTSGMVICAVIIFNAIF